MLHKYLPYSWGHSRWALLATTIVASRVTIYKYRIHTSLNTPGGHPPCFPCGSSPTAGMYCIITILKWTVRFLYSCVSAFCFPLYRLGWYSTKKFISSLLCVPFRKRRPRWNKFWASSKLAESQKDIDTWLQLSGAPSPIGLIDSHRTASCSKTTGIFSTNSNNKDTRCSWYVLNTATWKNHSSSQAQPRFGIHKTIGCPLRLRKHSVSSFIRFFYPHLINPKREKKTFLEM